MRSQALVSAALIAGLASCAPLRGYADDPADRSDLSSVPIGSGATVVPLYGPASEADYDDAPDDDTRGAVRNKIIRRRLWGYDQTYSSFKHRLALDGNVVSTGGSLVALVLGGVAATNGSIGVANALAAAGAGIVGAQGIVNRDLYFQKTLPAMIAQMDAAHDRALKPILDGMKMPVATYSLADANVDLQHLRDAGSIEGAINTISQSAADAKQQAQAAITRTRDYVIDRPDRVAVGQRLLDLTKVQAIALANVMVSHLDTASPEGQAAANRILPSSRMFASNQSNRARQFLKEWADQETMTPARLRVWDDEYRKIIGQGK